MDGVIWFFLALLVALTISGVVVGLRRRRSGVDPMSRQCSNCRTPMSPRQLYLHVLASGLEADSSTELENP
jgi:hypothetical protein